MDSQNYVEIINKKRWGNQFPIQKMSGFFYIGSDEGNDLVLERAYGEGVESRHLQVILGTDTQGYRLVNLAYSDVKLGPDQEHVLPQFQSTTIRDNTHVQVGDFTLIFHFQQSHRTESSGIGTGTGTSPIEVHLISFPNRLTVNQPIEGKCKVAYWGDELSVQLNLKVENFPAEYCRLDPYELLLFSGDEEEVSLKLEHTQKPEPKGGPHRIVIRAMAPDAYPDQSGEAELLVDIEPVFDFSLSLDPSS